MNKIDIIKCFFGFHKKHIIIKEKTKEIDSISGVNLTRNVYHCDICNKTFHHRTDNLIGISDKNWTWSPIDFYL